MVPVGITAGSYKPGSIVDTDLTLAANSAPVKVALNAAGDAPIFACRAWVNFNGTGTVAIRASGNVSSITDNGVGDYTVNFTTAMPDANFSGVATSGNQNSTFGFVIFNGLGGTGSSPFSTTQMRFVTANNGGAASDNAYVSVAIFR